MDHLAHLIKHCKMTLLSIAILITSLFSSTATVLATTPRSGVAAGDVQVTGVTVNKNDVKAGQKVNVGITFEGGQNVQPGKTITIDLPQNTTNLAGLHGVTGTINIDGTYNGQTVKDVATATISADKVTIKFNQSVTQLPNGFTGNFHFDAEAEAAQNSSDQKQSVTIDINGHTVVINVEHNTTPVGPGVSSLTPVDVSKVYINKGGYFGKDGKINWGIDGTTPAPISSDVTITDTPSGNIKAPINPSSWTIRVTAADGLSQLFTLQQAKDELRAKITFDQNGGFTAVFPADVLENTKWHIQYQAVPTKTPTNGDSFDNHAQIKYDQIVKDTDKTVQYKQNMGGAIAGFDSGKLTIEKQDGNTKVLLPGAQFTLYKDGAVVSTQTTDKSGKAVFNNLTDGNYTLKETKAPAGYQLSNKEYHFTISKGQLTNSDLPKSFILPNYKMASSSSAASSSSKASSKTSSAVKSSSKASSKTSSAVKSSSKASSKKSSSVKSSSVESSSKKSSSVKSSSVESSSKKNTEKSSSVESSSKKNTEKSSSVVSSSKKNTEKSSSVESSSKKNTEKSSSVESSSKKNTEKSSSVVPSSKKNTEKSSSVVSSSTNGSAKESSASGHKQELSSVSNGKEGQSSNGHKAGVVVTNNNNGKGNNTGNGQGNGNGSGNGNGNGSSYGSGLPQTGETQLTISLIAGVAILAGVAGAAVLNKKKR